MSYWRSRPRLAPVTLPAGTTLRLTLDEALSSETAVEGRWISAAVAQAVRVDDVEAVPAGSRVAGTVTHAASAGQAGGRGELTIAFDSVEPPDGGTTALATRPLALRAPAPRRKDSNALVAGLREMGAAVGGLIGGRDGAAAGTVVGGAAATVIVASAKGREVTLPANAALVIELTRPGHGDASGRAVGSATPTAACSRARRGGCARPSPGSRGRTGPGPSSGR